MTALTDYLDKLSTPDERGLLPCERCGSKKEMRRRGNEHTHGRSIVVRCPSCRLERTDAALRRSEDWLEGVAVTAANVRPLLAALRAAIAQRDAAMDAACLMSGTTRDPSGTGLLDAAILAKLEGKQ